MLTNIFNQLFIEGENNQLFVYIHLEKLSGKKASKILDSYVKNFKQYDFEKINVSFWDVNIPGEHLSSYRKTSDKAIAKILKGFKFIDSFYDFKQNQKQISEPQVV